MQRLADAGVRIRNFVNDQGLYHKQFKNAPDDWNLLTVAMDTFQDATSALCHFETVGMGSGTAEIYLRFYGMFQAFILQQDAISSLYRIFAKSALELKQNSAWQEIRHWRNMVVGHPLDKRGTPEEGQLKVFLVQTSISETGFTMFVCAHKTGKMRREEVDFKAAHYRYKLEALEHLAKIEECQELPLGKHSP